MSIHFKVESLNSGRSENHESVFREEIYGKQLKKETYFALFVGKITPKVCQNISQNSLAKPKPKLNIRIERKYLQFHNKLNRISARNIEDDFNLEEEKANDTENSSTKNGVSKPEFTKNEQIDPTIK